MESWKDLEDKLAKIMFLASEIVGEFCKKRDKCEKYVANLPEMTEEEYEQAVVKNERKTE